MQLGGREGVGRGRGRILSRLYTQHGPWDHDINRIQESNTQMTATWHPSITLLEEIQK